MTLVGKCLTQKELSSRPDTYSYSKVSSYLKCSQYYKLNYVDRVKVFKDTVSTTLGTFVHSALEYLYDDNDDEEVQTLLEAFYITSPKDLNKLGVKNTEQFIFMLNEYLADEDQLHYLASEECVGPECIRTKAGKIAKVPAMTTGWKEKEKQLDLPRRRFQIDSTFNNLKKEKADGFSIVEAYSTARLLCKNYQTPTELESIKWIEFPFSKWDKDLNLLINPISFSTKSSKEIFISGFIDLVCEIEIDGKIYTAIIDHKTSKEKFTKETVFFNRQLNLYTVLYEKLTGEQIDYIGINAIRDNELILTPVDATIRQEIFHSFIQSILSTKSEVYLKFFPDSPYSPCLNMFNKECPYLAECHPKYAETLTLVDLHNVVN